MLDATAVVDDYLGTNHVGVALNRVDARFRDVELLDEVREERFEPAKPHQSGVFQRRSKGSIGLENVIEILINVHGHGSAPSYTCEPIAVA